jgi:site-specific DNA recombinase
VPTIPPSATLREVADHIDEIIGSGSHAQRKALIEALVAQVKITGLGRIVPVFRIPQATGTGRADADGEISGVRAMTNLPLHPCGRSPRVKIPGRCGPALAGVAAGDGERLADGRPGW